MMKLSDLAVKKKEYMDIVKNSGEKLLKESFTDFFSENPEILGIKWAQYTPYFNDGDTCVFSCHFGGCEYLVEHENEEGWISDYSGDFDSEVTEQLQEKHGEKVDNFLGELEEHEDILEMIFGDHVEVTATRDGFEVNGYDHD